MSILGATGRITSHAANVRAKSRGGAKAGKQSNYGIPPVFTAQSPPGATRTVAYTYTFVASGDPAPYYEVSSGALPAGITLNALTGVISGTPTTAATYTFKIKAINSFYPAAETATKTIIVAP